MQQLETNIHNIKTKHSVFPIAGYRTTNLLSTWSVPNIDFFFKARFSYNILSFGKVDWPTFYQVPLNNVVSSVTTVTPKERKKFKYQPITHSQNSDYKKKEKIM